MDKELRYEIHWLDSGKSIQGWKSRQEILQEKLEVVESIGYKIHEDDDSIYLALTRDKGSRQYFGVQVIDKKSVRLQRRMRSR